jgi:Ca2+-binding RTX toxin-like protein
VDAVTGTIGATTINAGILSYIDVGVGLSTNAADTGAITASGGGHIKVTLGAGNAATYTPAGAAVARSSQGDVSGAAMTSPLSSLHVVGTNAKGAFALTGGAGNDTLKGGGGLDTITAGKGVDAITTGADADVVVFNVGDSNPVYTTIKNTATGQDTVTDNGTAATTAVLQFNITSTDTTWAPDHILVGTAIGSNTASATQGNTHGFTNKMVLVHTGATAAAGAATSDPVDIAVIMNTGLNVTQARAISKVNLTGTSGGDSLTTGALADTIDGGAGDDTIDAKAGADTINVSQGDDTVTIEDDQGIAATAVSTAGSAVFAVGDTITFGNGVDIVNGFEAGTGGDVMNMDHAFATLAPALGVAENLFHADTSSIAYLSGTFVSSTGVFTITANGAAGSSTLLIDTADQDIASNNDAVLLVGVDVDLLVAANIT